ncbi:carboxylic ester hydrolase [Candidatus Odyssella thessalonicensis]|uniref:alpha/beta hydrolase n=1 Tax=Candidatus Odyssella thessalonicensis TaxID=84647 RepID=UPI000225A8E2|nr:carboxylic ester hydrolase [Candidatus Odyssella thessalonicensis]
MRTVLKKFLFGLSVCWATLAFTKDQLVLPKPTGHYAVGTRAIELMDCSRTLLRSKNKKRLMVQAFYPVLAPAPGKGPYPYMPATLEEGVVENIQVLAWAQPEAPALSSAKFPIIIFTPGRGAQRQQYTILLEELASHGYVVLAIDQPYVANFVKFPNGDKVVLSLKDAWYVLHDRDYRYAYDDKVIEGALGDIDYLINHLDKLEDVGQACDHTNIILMGHSLGANIAHIAGFKDDRINAVIDIDSKITEREVFGHIGVPPNPEAKPVLFIRGALQYQEEVGDQLTKVQNATIWSPAVEHSAFCDNAYFANKLHKFGTNGTASTILSWLFKEGPFWRSIDTHLGDKDADAWFHEYRAYIIDWLLKARQHIITKKMQQIPVGDQSHTEVYNFIKDFLLKQKKWSASEIQNLIDTERRQIASSEPFKSYTDTTSEGEMSGLLRILCRSNKSCRCLTLYQRDGVEVAHGDASVANASPFLLQLKHTLDEWIKDEINLGTLGLTPTTRLGRTARIDTSGNELQEVIQAIYYNKERDYAYLATKVTTTQDQIIGYVRYIFQ